MKILVIQQKMIGDVLVSTILCDNLRKAYPFAQIDYMVYQSTMPVLQGNPNIDNLILFEEKHRNSYWYFFKLIIQIRKSNYDIVIDSYSKLESWLTVLFSGANKKISYKKKGRSLLYTHNVPFLMEPKSNIGLTIERRLSLLNPLHLDIKLEVVPKLYVTDAEKDIATSLFNEYKLNTSRKTVMMSIIGSSENKTYPLKYMSKIVDFISNSIDVNILFNYIPNQLDQAQIIYNHCSEKTKNNIYFNVLGKNLREFIAIMNACDFIIGNDSGSINMAKALNKPSFIIFSPWIEKKMWATFEDGNKHDSVHLKDFKPKYFEKKTGKELKLASLKLYPNLKPEFIYPKLLKFLNNQISSNQNVINEPDYNAIYEQQRAHKLSALIITFNEEERIGALIESLNFADEIVVVDSFSTDNTISILENYNHVKIIQHPFENFSKQRNFALQQIVNDWVLFIDADELLTKKLESEIKEILKNPKGNVAFEMYRQFYYKEQPLHFSGWQTDKVFRLFNKKNVIFEPTKYVHETLNINGKTSILKNKLTHYSYKNFKDYKGKMDSYAKLRALELFEKKLKPNFYHYYLKPMYRFFNHYIIRLGILDGKNGYTICKLNAYGVKQRYIELKKLYQL